MAEAVALRPLNVALSPGSPALSAYAQRAGLSDEALAKGFAPQPGLDLTFRGGRTIADLAFVNCYLGGDTAWRGPPPPPPHPPPRGPLTPPPPPGGLPPKISRAPPPPPPAPPPGGRP